MSLISITNNFVSARDTNSECQRFSSREKQEIKREATECSRTQCKTKRASDDETKNIAGRIPETT